MSAPNANISGGLSAAFGFLLLLLLPFQTIFKTIGLDAFYAEHLGDLSKNLVIIIFAVLLIVRRGYQNVAGINTVRTKNTLLIVVPLYFVLAGPIQYWALDYQFDSIQAIDLLLLLLAMMSVGLSEELVFRGFILPHLIAGVDNDQTLKSPIITLAFLFGVLHLLNLLSSDAHVALVLAQVTYATMFGVAFGILLLRTGGIYPIGFLHGIINFSGNLHDLPGASEPSNIDEFKIWEALISVAIVLPFFFFAWRQLPKINQEALMHTYKQDQSENLKAT